MEPFKNKLSFEKVVRLAEVLEAVSKDFSRKRFELNLEEELAANELKGRVRLVAERIEAALPLSPPEVFEVLRRALLEDRKIAGLILWPFTEVVARLGAEHFEESMAALREITPRSTAEFAIRPFLLKDQTRTLKHLQQWCDDPDEHVRRLVSEGSRPLLPWGMRLPALMDEPALGMTLLEKLYLDSSPYVRLSVSNHLNDLSKKHPELVLKTLGEWRAGAPENRDLEKLSRHASRTLLKQGHPGALDFHGFGEADSFEVEIFSLNQSAVCIGAELEYFLKISNTSKRKQKLLFDYAIHHRKANGGLTSKVFKGRVREIEPGESTEIIGSHSFKLVTTRRYYPGTHRFEPKINGKSHLALDFKLRI
jgi:3-methyladenine DNA glycosylase AlkC